MIRNHLGPMRAALNKAIYKYMPDMKKLDDAYSTEYGVRLAYDAGRDAMSATGVDAGEAFDTFKAVQGGRSVAELAAFAEAVKYKIVEDLTTKSTATSVANYFDRHPGRKELLREVVANDQQVDDMIRALDDNIEQLVLNHELSKGVELNAPSGATDEQVGLGTLADIAIMGGATFRAVSTALGAGAV